MCIATSSTYIPKPQRGGMCINLVFADFPTMIVLAESATTKCQHPLVIKLSKNQLNKRVFTTDRQSYLLLARASSKVATWVILPIFSETINKKGEWIEPFASCIGSRKPSGQCYQGLFDSYGEFKKQIDTFATR